jgi:hypothetical protein
LYYFESYFFFKNKKLLKRLLLISHALLWSISVWDCNTFNTKTPLLDLVLPVHFSFFHRRYMLYIKKTSDNSQCIFFLGRYILNFFIYNYSVFINKRILHQKKKLNNISAYTKNVLATLLSCKSQCINTTATTIKSSTLWE